MLEKHISNPEITGCYTDGNPCSVREISQLLSDGISLTAPAWAETPQEQGQDMENLSPAIALKQHWSGDTDLISSNKEQIFEGYYMLLLF